MLQRKKPRCFVAMAFDYDDTDKIYDDFIEPILKKNNVIPIIINRREDNEDINNQIITQLNLCDFCIADLTYTRPSVYFEAGYAQRYVDVIYTVRSDHLNKNQPEDRRVHFDLQMKPIIKWQDSSDPTFASRFEKRLKSTVLKDFNKKIAVQNKLDDEIKKFMALPIDERLRIIRVRVINKLRQIGFKNWKIRGIPSYQYRHHENQIENQIFKDPSQYAHMPLNFHGYYKEGNKHHFIILIAKESITQNYLRGAVFSPMPFLSLHLHLPDIWDLKSKIQSNKEEIHCNIIFFSLKNIPESRIMAAMPMISKENNRYRYKDTKEIYSFKKEGTLYVPIFFELFFISDIKSEAILKDKMGDILSELKH
jgi:nucleoside 2-deoxyribosyltransferase